MRRTLVTASLLFLSACSGPQVSPTGDPSLSFPGETRISNLRQLTHGGTNAEAYWSFDGKHLSFQHKGADGVPACDQIDSMGVDGSDLRQLSSGKGRTTCSFYFPAGNRILFASTEAFVEGCPANPDMSQGYVWPIYNTYQLFSVKEDGTDLLPLEAGEPRSYNAEATVCSTDGKNGEVVFTSDRDGDLELYRAHLDPLGHLTDVTRLTNTPGYDGGAFFSPDCKKLVWRASRPLPGKELDDYRGLLKQHLVRPGQLEIWTADADGSHARQVTRLGVASFAPYFDPDGKHILFAANRRDPNGRHFDLYRVGINGADLEQVTFSDSFDSFPMFAPDGKHLAFSSNRNAKQPHETNVFIADWNPNAAVSERARIATDADRFLHLVEQLSAPEMEGRGLGTPGLAKAEALVTSIYKEIGLKPFFDVFKSKDGEGYLHPVEVALKSETLKGHNVLGVWGDGCARTAPVVIGAHLDHLGSGGENSLEPSQKGIHPGADDNASGVAGVIEAARIILSQPPNPKRTCLVFAAFTGEEIGIAGSSRLMELFKKLKIHPKAMLNLDMVGRMENNTLIAFGTDSAQEWKGILEEACVSRHLSCPGGGDGYGPSDHMAFYLGLVPVVHFFTGPHLDYHRTTDTADKINATGGIQAAEVVAAVALRAVDPKLHFHFQKASAAPSMGALHGDKEHRSSGAYLGTIPDYSVLTSPHGPAGGKAPGGGVKLAGTRPGSPADKAGVQPGDVLTGINDLKIESLQEFTNVLTQLKPGQEVVLLIRRKGEALRLRATVGKRGQ